MVYTQRMSEIKNIYKHRYVAKNFKEGVLYKMFIFNKRINYQWHKQNKWFEGEE